ncbi:MAG: ABC transporter permease, partial [Aliihoeflea sp.]
MSAFFLKRIAQALIAVIGVMTLIFFLQRLTGDPVLLLVPQNATQADILAMRETLGFNRPLAVQYLDYMTGLLSFDFGRSYVQNV